MQVIKDMFKSKKALAAMATVVVNLIVGLLPADALDAEGKTGLITAITGIAAAYLIGQGVADHGKEAAKQQAKNDSL